MARPHRKRTNRIGINRISSAGSLLHWIGMVAMVVGLFAPLATAEAASTILTPERAMLKAAQQPFDADTAEFERVVLVGDFQQQFGCAPWDVNCEQSRLQNNNGFWTGAFNVPPGNWQWELVAFDRNGTQYSVAENQVAVAEGQLGIYAEFNSASRQNNVWAVTNLAVASGPFGTVALAQDGEGFVASAINVTADGPVDLQVQVNGQPVQTTAQLSRGANRVSFDALGNVTNVESLGFAEITVQRVDADGNPLSGSCFVLDGTSQTRGCDYDDDTSGSITLRFPAGVQPGTYTLRETRPADGAEPIADQQIDVQPGMQTTVEARSAGPAEPESGDLVVLRQDLNGNMVGGACFDLVNANGEVEMSVCDEDGDVADDGRIGFLGAPAGDYTLRETRTPEGYEPAAEVTVTILPNDVVNLPVQSAAVQTDVPIETEIATETEIVTEVATETEVVTEIATETEVVTEIATEETRVGRVIVYRTDEFGAPVGGSCFAVVDQSGQTVNEACDEDGIAADDGTTGVENIPVGTYTVVETRVPTGYQKTPDTPVTVVEGDNEFWIAGAAEQVATEEVTDVPVETEIATEEVTEVPVETETATEETAQTGDLVVRRTNTENQPVNGSCYDLLDANGIIIGQQCEGQGPEAGVVVFPDVPVGNVTVVETNAPENTELAPVQQTEVQADTENEIVLTTQSLQQPAADTASLTVNYTWAEGDPFACVEIVTDASIIGSLDVPYACDNGDNDTNPEAGVIGMTNLPAGQFLVDAYQGPDYVVQADPMPVTLAAEAPQTVTFEAPAPALTSFTVNTTDGTSALSGACYVLDDGETQYCDDGTGAVIDGVAPGPHTVTIVSAPSGYAMPETVTQSVEVLTEGTAPVTFTLSQNLTSFTVNTTDGTSALSGACYVLDDGETQYCDDGTGAVIDGVAPGPHTVTIVSAPSGYAMPETVTQSVEVLTEGTAPVTFTLSQNLTSFTVNTTDGMSALSGACYVLDDGETQYCDDGTGAVIDGVTPGPHTVTIVSAPDGYAMPETVTQSVEVLAEGTAPVTFTLSQNLTSFTVNTTDGTSALSGACYVLDDGETQYCDDGTGAVIDGVAPGPHTVTIVSAPAGYAMPETVTQSVEVLTEGTAPVTFTLSQNLTSFTVNTTDGTSALSGACYVLDDGETQYCDDGTGAVIDGVAPGPHTVTIVSAPDGYSLPETVTQSVEVLAEATAPVTFTLSAAEKTVQISTLNSQTNEPVTDVCYTLGESDPTCADEGSNLVVFENVPQEDQTLTMQSAPDGFALAQDQTVPADVTEVSVPLQVELGTVQVTIVDGDGTALGGACVTLDSDRSACDDEDGADDGLIIFADVTVGPHTITITQGPAGFDLPAELTQSVTVAANTSADVTFALTATPPTTSGLDVTVLYSDETPVEGVCITITHADGAATAQQSACDDADGTVDGMVAFNDLPLGTYSVALQEGFTPDRPIDTVVPASASVPADVRGTAVLTLPLAPTTGSVQVTVQSGGVNLSGACIAINGTTVCDNAAGDVNATAGVIAVSDLEPNTYEVTMPTVPSGYQAPAAQPATVTAGETAELVFDLEREVLPGTVTVRTLDGDAGPLNGACYALVQEGSTLNTLCDSDPSDGEILFENVPAGTYQLVQTRTPGSQFQTAPTRFVDVAAGENTIVEVVIDVRPGRLTVRTVDRDEPTLVLQNACFILEGAASFGPFCDTSDGNVDGLVRFNNVPPGEYELRQTVATAGYEPAANRTITINPAGSLQITILNARVQPPAESGTLQIVPLDPTGAPVAGGCYQVFDGDNPISQRICDNADETPAQITIADLPVGEFTLREQLAPSPDWQIAADQTVTINNGETTRVEVPHVYKNGHVVIQAVNTVGLPLQNACFTLTNAGDTELCTDTTGQITVSDLAPGSRQLTQTSAPFGFRLDTTPREVMVRPGQTTTVRVVFQNEPPPNTGTVQVQKFVCPAGEEGERTQFLGGAQGNQQLKQTAGCVPGVATFTLEAEDGSTESNATFSTNEDGRAQRTAVAGIYLLTETDPDLPGNSAARIRVGVGQMTTVIVINYVAPPKPAPVTINVEGYTCPPGFNGSSFVDFQNSCMAQSQLTNQIIVRAESTNRFKRITGDTGVLGKTTFNELPAGTYTIWAERPFTIPVSYLFCGVDPNNPNLKSVNGSISTTQQSGSTITCRVFQVPPLFDANNGAIQVQKYNCPINERQRGYDYKNECSRATEPIPFEIQMVDPKSRTAIGQPVRVSTNGDGIVQFPMLTPGTYKLTEVNSEWCFAQSNSVDAQGDVVVTKNKLSEVWVYNCVGTKSPPNTGSGDAAENLNPDGGIGPMQVVPNLIWPTVLLAGWVIWRERKQA